MLEIMTAVLFFVATAMIATAIISIMQSLGYREEVRQLLKQQQKLILMVKAGDAMTAQNVVQRHEEAEELIAPEIQAPPKPTRVQVGSRRFTIFGLDPQAEADMIAANASGESDDAE